MDEQENRFARGFNSGYFLAEHEPELGITVVQAAGNAKEFSEYAHGLVSGYSQYVNDKSLSETKEQPTETKSQESTAQKQDPESIYQTGFNHGYLLTKYEPELARQVITPQKNPSDYQQGLTAGRQEYDIELLNNRLKSISQNKSNQRDQSKDRER